MDIGNLGMISITTGLKTLADRSSKLSAEIDDAFRKYYIGDWGELDEEDWKANDEAVNSPGSDRILAAYKTEAGKIFIITEADRSATTILLADEY